MDELSHASKIIGPLIMSLSSWLEILTALSREELNDDSGHIVTAKSFTSGEV